MIAGVPGVGVAKISTGGGHSCNIFGILNGLMGRNKGPFCEFLMGEREFEEKINSFKNDGYFSVTASGSTKDFLNGLIERGEWGGEDKIHIEDERFHELMTDFALRVLKRIDAESTPSRLIFHECEIRRPENGGATSWHTDRAPKVLTCLMTLEGIPTQFVTPQAALEKFEAHQNIPGHIQERKDNPLSEADINHVPDGCFVFLACDGFQSDQVSKLVHRAPPSPEQRTIFLARWKPDRGHQAHGKFL